MREQVLVGPVLPDDPEPADHGQDQGVGQEGANLCGATALATITKTET